MGLLEKTLNLAKKATERVIDTAGKKIEEARQKRIEEEQKFLREFPYKHRYTIRQKDSVSVDLVFGDVLERDSYVVYDADDEPVYMANGTVLMGKHHFVITNREKEELAKVNKALVNMPIPFMKERKSCMIEVAGEESFEMDTYISSGEREYSIYHSDLTIKADANGTEFRLVDRKTRKTCVHIYKVRSDEGFFKDKYYVGFDDETKKMMAICAAIGIDTIRFSED